MTSFAFAIFGLLLVAKGASGLGDRMVSVALAFAVLEHLASTDRIRTGAERIFPSRDCTTDEALLPDSQLRVVNMIGGHLGLLGLEPAHMEQIASHLGELLALEPYAPPRRSRQIDRRPAPTSPRP